MIRIGMGTPRSHKSPYFIHLLLLLIGMFQVFLGMTKRVCPLRGSQSVLTPRSRFDCNLAYLFNRNPTERLSGNLRAFLFLNMRIKKFLRTLYIAYFAGELMPFAARRTQRRS